MTRRIAPTVVLVLAAALLAGCGGDEPAEPARSFDEQLCLSIALWSEGLVAAVNEFQDESRSAGTPAERRTLYLGAWDRVEEVIDDLAAALGDLDADDRPYGPAVIEALSTALDDTRADIAAGREEATSLPAEAYEPVTVPDGSLFRGTEKVRARLFNALNDIAAAEDAEPLGGDCGRRPLINQREN
jgi:hypothetical protein